MEEICYSAHCTIYSHRCTSAQIQIESSVQSCTASVGGETIAAKSGAVTIRA